MDDTSEPSLDAIRRVMSAMGRRSVAATRQRLTPDELRARMSDLGKRGGRAGRGTRKPRKPKPAV